MYCLQVQRANRAGRRSGNLDPNDFYFIQCLMTRLLRWRRSGELALFAERIGQSSAEWLGGSCSDWKRLKRSEDEHRIVVSERMSVQDVINMRST